MTRILPVTGTPNSEWFCAASTAEYAQQIVRGEPSPCASGLTPSPGQPGHTRCSPEWVRETDRLGSDSELTYGEEMPDTENTADRACSIQASLDVLGDRWTILIMRDAFRGVRRFDDFRRDLDIARPVLTERLKRLVVAGVLERRLYCERPPRYEYRLTPMGAALSPTLVALMRWGDEWINHDEPPTVLVHEACGEPLDQAFVCWHCDETFTQSAIASRPGNTVTH